MTTLRVLVCDDEMGMRVGVARTLRDHRIEVPDHGEPVCFEVDQAQTAEQALWKIRDRAPDLLLLDQKLPGMSGMELLKALEQDTPDMLTVMITAYATIDSAVHATKMGTFDYLPKPFTPAELKDAVRKAAAHLLLVRHARRLEEERRRVRFEFIRVLGHELKSPLNAVTGYLQILNDPAAAPDPATAKQMIDRSLIRIDHMRKLIVDLLDMTRIESGQRRRELVEVDLAEVARMAMETLEPAAQERRITVALHADGPTAINADRTEMEIILNNLVSNAVKYNRDGGRVDIELSCDSDSITIQVADTGIGMSPDEAAKLFREFVRIKNAKTRNILGSGLGLSIVKRIAEMYHGAASVESEPEVGSTFTVTLQRRSEQTAENTDDLAEATNP